MKAAHEDQLLLLDLQKLDQQESRLRHQRDSHPAHATLKELAGRADDLRRAAVTQTAVISDIRRESEKLETEVDKVRTRRATQQGRLDRGEVPLRDMSAMEHEIARMDQRISDLEDAQLDAEERLEAAEGAERAMRDEAAAIAADVEATRAQFSEDMSGVEAELRRIMAERRELAERVPEDLLAEYERSRSRNGTLAVIEVREGVAMGAATDLAPAELGVIARIPDDEVYWAEETGQLVVRTGASR
ncbi:MAG: hypothetical protein LKI58_06450 [Actinomyces sp.]|nr:hypothetical protein [Actinomyces sp.]MCI1642532.1 hypothetical protein [Actinomyces sp.]MCI1663126.1 hypothetical protein [Actinomyces sp.]MCI1691280.1 hypothetical protein [Actinomyces sp.]MCI1787691.1 hypothetical protein [Actinomyces sp.]MCI1830401.1 hypothetical protein [Actinomyces sp.]